ncbi:spore coat protein [Alicyclobacillus mengziensis]|uniref:Spore coat protein n=1 Tax=Alicyclobacillus mengziensis TaxID=2931921 RepID=A0A9X7Z913_9BACL|nr:spore coat protein [Alicyclobacillus mengziensis]QSO49023.1 spore coat protein [Alicyclobacillus mengziensis]
MNMQMGMSEHDMVTMLLAEEKRVAGEYVLATVEANCQTVHDVFARLLQNTLQTQRQVFKVMEQNNWYPAPSPAPSQEVQKQIQRGQQTKQETDQFLGAIGASRDAAANQMLNGAAQQAGMNHQRPM